MPIVLFLFETFNVSQTEFCLRLQVERTRLGPIDRASPYLRWTTIGTVQKHNTPRTIILLFLTYSRQFHGECLNIGHYDSQKPLEFIKIVYNFSIILHTPEVR
jgi:hypothetical protein